MNNIPAFPTERIGVESGEVLTYQEEGMTLRDYFAAKAMQGFLDQVGWKSDQIWFDEIAEGAYKMANAMMEARNAAQ